MPAVVTVLQPLAPHMAAALVAWITSHDAEPRRLAASLKPWRRMPARRGLGWRSTIAGPPGPPDLRRPDGGGLLLPHSDQLGMSPAMPST
jgi:hypothetical protein